MSYYFLSDPREATMHDLLLNQLRSEMADAQMDGESLQEQIQNRLEQVVPEVFEATFQHLRHEIKQEQKLIRDFNKRNYARWQKGFEIAHTMILLSQDLGAFVLHKQEDEPKHAAKFQAIINLHAKSLRVGREILCLLENGFADGALGRWRTLHETATVASFLAANDDAIAGRFIRAREVQNYKAAHQYIEHQERANLKPFGESELEKLGIRYEQIIAADGPEMKSDWGWAAPALNGARPTFAKIEEARGLDHWRPRYKWSSEDNHGNYKPNETHLAFVESTNPSLLAGRSNSGMIDPVQMLGCSLHLAASTLLSLNQQFDLYTWLEVMGILNVKLGEIMFGLENARP